MSSQSTTTAAADTDAERKVAAVGIFHPDEEPTHHKTVADVKDTAMMTPTEKAAADKAKYASRMELHRALWLGAGFWEWMTKPAAASGATDIAAAMADLGLGKKCRPLPVEDFLKIEPTVADAIVEEALPGDRERFRTYLSHRSLGLGLITAGPGFGKTTALAAAALAMCVRHGPVLCSGPNDVSVSNFAQILDSVIRRVASRCNHGKDTSDRTRHRVVVRGFNEQDEESAFVCLLRDPEAGDEAARQHGSKSGRNWRLHLSLAYWALVVLRSRAVNDLHGDDNPLLFNLRAFIEEDTAPNVVALRGMATGAVEFDEKLVDRLLIRKLFTVIIESVCEFLCTTAALTSNVELYRGWKADRARAVAFDDANALSRPDCYGVWGNCLLPCFMSGDLRQWAPVVRTGTEKAPDGCFRHHLVRDGKLSAMEFLVAQGMPVYRLRVQLRMAEGQFDMMSQLVCKDVPFTYGDETVVTNPAFQIGHDLEAFLRARFPGLSPPPAGKLLPVFVHTPGVVFTNPGTGSMRAPAQVEMALELISGLVSQRGVNLADIGIITVYRANLDLIKKAIKTRFPSLASMAEATTVESGYQGNEKPVIVVIMGTAHPHPGPGYTTDQRRLNVIMTRHKAALLVVGDINVGGPYDMENGSVVRRGRGKPENFLVETATGETAHVDGKALQSVYGWLIRAKRVANL